MSILGTTVSRPCGPGYLRKVPASEWVRRLEGIEDPALRGGIANILDWDFFLHLKVGHASLQTPAYKQLMAWGERNPAGALQPNVVEKGLMAVGYMDGDANRRAFGDWERCTWNPFGPMGDHPVRARSKLRVGKGKGYNYPEALLDQVQEMMKQDWALVKIGDAIGRSDTTARFVCRAVRRRAETKKSPVEGQAHTGQDTRTTDSDN